MKKVLFLVPSLGMGGMERVLVNYANLFADRGYDVTVYNLTYDSEDIICNFDKHIHYYNNFKPIHNILKSSIRDILKGRFYLLSFGIWLRIHTPGKIHRIMIKEQFDIEIAFFGDICMRIASGADKKRTSNIGFIHSSDLKKRYADKRSIDKARETYLSIDRIICVSQVVKRQFEEVFGKWENLYTVNNPNNTKRIRELSNDGNISQKKHFTFINVSRIDNHSKGFFRLLDVCKRLNSEGYKYDLWIVGDGIDFDAVTDRAKQLELNNITFLGQQKNPYKFMKNADMYLCASYYEGFSMTVSEAIILGLPVLTTQVSGADEMFEKGTYGLIVDNSEEGIYEGIKSILSNKNLYSHYAEMAEKRKDYLSEEKIMDRLEQIINGG